MINGVVCTLVGIKETCLQLCDGFETMYGPMGMTAGHQTFKGTQIGGFKQSNDAPHNKAPTQIRSANDGGPQTMRVAQPHRTCNAIINNTRGMHMCGIARIRV